MTPDLRSFFDQLLEQELAKLPLSLHRLLDETPLLVEDRPSPQILADMGLSNGDELCGLYHGIPRTAQSVDIPAQLPPYVFLYREGICRLSGCHRAGQNRDELREQIRITLLHEIGHHFGLSEQDLEELGYG